MEQLRPRLVSWWWDYVTVVVWLLIVFVVVGIPTLVGWLDLTAVFSRPIAADTFVTILTVLPWFTYLTLTEAGPSAATWGKRRTGLVVIAVPGVRAGPARTAARNLVKVAPWQFGHLAAQRFATGDYTAAAVVFYVVSLGLLAMVAGPPLGGRRGLHDLLAGTAVTAARR